MNKPETRHTPLLARPQQKDERYETLEWEAAKASLREEISTRVNKTLEVLGS